MSKDILIHTQNIVLLPIDQVKRYPKNNKKHGSKKVSELAKMISTHGFDQPLVVRKEDSYLIKGEGRFLAAQKLGMTHVPVVLKSCTEDEARAERIKDNKIAEYDTTYDIPSLAFEMKHLSVEFKNTPLVPLDDLISSLDNRSLSEYSKKYFQDDNDSDSEDSLDEDTSSYPKDDGSRLDIHNSHTAEDSTDSDSEDSSTTPTAPTMHPLKVFLLPTEVEKAKILIGKALSEYKIHYSWI